MVVVVVAAAEVLILALAVLVVTVVDEEEEEEFEEELLEVFLALVSELSADSFLEVASAELLLGGLPLTALAAAVSVVSVILLLLG